MSKLNRSFYLNSDTLSIAHQLIGKSLVTNIDGHITSGIICETEAYLGFEDKASHAYANKRTSRTEIMYQEGGIAYVYLCYGVHFLFNVVTHQKNTPHAVLIRNIIPENGIEFMLKRRNRTSIKKLTTGPGTISQALGINLDHNGLSLLESTIWIEDSNQTINDTNIHATPRIGVDYAGKDAALPYRFLLKNNAESF